jgi:hypothetical protein
MSITTPVHTTVVLYDSALGGTPETQGKIVYRTSPSAIATQTFEDGATTLDTTQSLRDAAGYMADSRSISPLDRAPGYALNFTVRVVEEAHGESDKDGDGIGDRAGFSVIVLSNDLKGIELGFWPDQIWAQEGGAEEPPAGTLFTHAEGATFDTASRLISYTLEIHGATYHLSSDDKPILSGPLRDYTRFEGPVNPYRTPNFIFLGDDTSSAQAIIKLAYVALSRRGKAA